MAATDTTGGLSSSFTDLMTSLAVIFILLLVALVNNKQRELAISASEVEDIKRRLEAAERQLEAEREKSKTTRLQVLAALQQELALLSAQGVEVKEDPKDPLGLLVVVPEGLLEFAVDRAEIPAGGNEFLRDFVPRLAKSACQYQQDLSSITVEGHADSSGTDEHNLKLSQDRSISVVRESLRVLHGGAGAETPNYEGCFLDLLSASGRGRREPILVGGIEDRARSRRVVFKLRVRSFEQREAQVAS
jgi:outer membrane protein OmpA-like peptidoglycan-associated protein